MSDGDDTVALQTCPLCEAACGLTIAVRSGKPVRVRGDNDDPVSKGFLCPKGASLIPLHDDPDRLRLPLIRRNGSLEPVSWDAAFAEADRLVHQYRDHHGRDTLATYIGNPSGHNLSLVLYVPHLLRAVGSEKHFSASSVDVLPKQLTCALMYGHSYSIPVPDVDRTKYLLILGANPLVSNGSMLTAPDMGGRMERIRAGGGRVVVVDPRRTKTAEAADEHVFIRPATDVWLLAAMARTLFVDGLVDLRDLDGHVAGLAPLRDALERFTPEEAEQRTGVAASTIVRLAHELAASPSGVVYGRVGTCIQEHGTLSSWLIEVLNVLTGNLDARGGAMFTSPVTERVRDASWLPDQEQQYDRFRSRISGLPETFGELPATALAEDILEPGPGRIRGLVVVAGNPALSIPDSHRMRRALEDLDLLICIDSYLNETSRHAHVVFPGESPLERKHFSFIARWGLRRYARWTPGTVTSDARPHEWEIVLALAGMLGGDRHPIDVRARDQAMFERRVRREVADATSPIASRDADEIMDLTDGDAGPERLLDLLLRIGREGDAYGANPIGLSLARLRAAPHGLDLGASEPQIPRVLTTASRQVEVAPTSFVDALTELGGEPAPEPDSRFPFELIGRRQLRSNNSWMHNVPTLVRGRPQCTLLMHPSDGARLGIHDGQTVRVTSSTGSVDVAAELTDSMLTGVVSLPHGWGHDQPGARLRVAETVSGVNSNVLGDAGQRDRLTGTSVGNGIAVAVSPITQASAASLR